MKSVYEQLDHLFSSLHRGEEACTTTYQGFHLFHRQVKSLLHFSSLRRTVQVQGEFWLTCQTGNPLSRVDIPARATTKRDCAISY